MRKSLSVVALTTLTALLATGCFVDPNKKDTTTDGGGTTTCATWTCDEPTADMKPVPTNSDLPPVEEPTEDPTEEPTPPLYAGSYLVKTKLDLTDKGVLPGVAGPILAFIADLDNKPFTAFLYLLKDSNIPTVSAGLQSVPGWVLDAGGAVGDAIVIAQVFDPNPEVKMVLSQISNIAEIFQTLEITNQISIGAETAPGTFKITQQIVALGFEYGTQKKSYNLSLAARMNAMIKGKSLVVTNVKTMADFDGYFDGGSIDLPVGEFMLNAINDLVLSPWGYSSLGNLLAEAFPCEALAEEVDIDSVETYCELGITALAEVALKPIKDFALHGVVVGRASVNGYDRKAAEAQDNTTDKLKGTQTFSLIVNSTTIEIKDAKFEGDRLNTPVVTPVW